jgi:hypothetical protein
MVGDDRGQLILVGAIAIALVLLGLVLIVNTALFTQVVGSEGTVETAKDGGLTGQEIGDAIGDVVATENRAHESVGTIESDVDTTVSDHLQPAFANRTFESGGSVISVDYLAETRTGATTAQDAAGPYTDASNDPNWDPIATGEASEIEAIFLTIHTDDSSLSSPFEMTVDGASGSMDVQITDVGSGNVEVEIDGPATTTTCTVSPTDDTVRIDVTAGRVYEDGSCTFDSFERLDGPMTVEFDDGDEVEGTYEIVSEDPLLAFPGPDPRFDSSDDTPTRSEVVLAFEYEFTYDSTVATVDSVSREVEVYD